MRKPRVIIFDDDAMLLEVMELYFDKWGYEVFPYQSPMSCLFNGSAGGCKNLASCADLMISDFQMPQITGMELFHFQEQRGCSIGKKMKALMSGQVDEALLKQCNNSGYRFFKKPFSFSELDSWVNECEQNFDLSKQLGGKMPDKRHDFRRNIVYHLNSSSPDETYIALTLNKSFDGLGVRVFDPLYAGQEITILDGLETPNLNGTVIWCNKIGEDSYRAGLRLSQCSGAN